MVFYTKVLGTKNYGQETMNTFTEFWRVGRLLRQNLKKSLQQTPVPMYMIINFLES